jgi:hypothetical protein
MPDSGGGELRFLRRFVVFSQLQCGCFLNGKAKDGSHKVHADIRQFGWPTGPLSRQNDLDAFM